MNNKKIKVITLIIVLILIVIGISFAITSPSINLLGRREIKISKCELDINFKESDELMLVSKYPISKEEALKYDAKDITITNNSTCDTAYYKVTIKDINGSNINKNIINYQLIDNSTSTETIDKNPDSFLIINLLTKGKSTSYSIRLWIDESATNTDLYENGDTTKPYEYKYALNIETSDEDLKEEVSPALEFAQSKVGTDGLKLVTHTIDSTLQVNSSFKKEYRYRGGDSTVKNFVTFNDEIWRIIGILPTEDTDGNVEYRFKIIRNILIGEYDWNECTYNDGEICYDSGKYLNNWTGATLNTYLNGDYYNSLSTDAQNMIGTAKYYLGGYYDSDISSDVMWQYERKNDTNRSGYYYGTNPVVQSDASKKIAIMYASDYGYAAPTTCTNTLQNYNNDACRTFNNWLDRAIEDWLLPQNSGFSDNAFIVYDSGSVFDSSVYSYQLAVRPVLYLSSSVMISGGTGTSSDPYTLSVN